MRTLVGMIKNYTGKNKAPGEKSEKNTPEILKL